MSRNRQELLRPARITALARRISASGAAVVLVLVLAMGVIVERSIIGGGSHGATSALPRPRSPVPTVFTYSPTVKPSSPPVSLPLSTLEADVRSVTSSQLGDVAQRAYGRAPTASPMVTLAHANHAHNWAMGTTVIPVPSGDTALPEVSLFVAHVTDGRWRVALAGTPAFTDLLSAAPTSVVPAAQQRVLSQFGTTTPAASITSTGLMLPWKIGQSWTMKSAPGGLDFSGKSARVLAAGPGWLYRFCDAKPGHGLVLLIHPNGLATTYYQMSAVTNVPDGTAVKVGDYLGKIGTDLPCGGTATKPAVRFGLAGTALDGMTIGGWTFHAETLSGWAEHGTKRIMPGGVLDNYGSPPMRVPVLPLPSPVPTPVSPSPGSPMPSLPAVPPGAEATP
jgi:murein DD-endopeptidase MepM/ murein hydrolase activator NlpD